jgi:DNA-binding transcriptional LysR family regulator
MLVEALTKLSITPNIALETGSEEILKQFAANQLGVAFIPDMVVEKELINHTLKKLKWTGTEFPVFSQVLVHKDKYVNSAMKGLIEMIAF